MQFFPPVSSFFLLLLSSRFTNTGLLQTAIFRAQFHYSIFHDLPLPQDQYHRHHHYGSGSGFSDVFRRWPRYPDSNHNGVTSVVGSVTYRVSADCPSCYSRPGSKQSGPGPKQSRPASKSPATPVLATSGPRAALLHEEDLPHDLRALSRQERLVVILTRAQIREISFFSYGVRSQFRTIWTAEGMLRAQYNAFAEGLPPYPQIELAPSSSWWSPWMNYWVRYLLVAILAFFFCFCLFLCFRLSTSISYLISIHHQVIRLRSMKIRVNRFLKRFFKRFFKCFLNYFLKRFLKRFLNSFLSSFFKYYFQSYIKLIR
jgi:hypothetical protein